MKHSDPIVWNERLITGIGEIDDQHHILVNMLNEVNAKLGGNPGLDFLNQVTRNLLSYALYHFETEEELMQQAGYALAQPQEAELHLSQHRYFSARVVAVREGLKAGNLVSREELLSFLNGWLVEHILNTDKQLTAYLLARQPPP